MQAIGFDSVGCGGSRFKPNNFCLCTEKHSVSSAFFIHIDQKEKKIFLIYKEIQMGAVSKSYMRKGFLMYEKMRKYLTIYEEAISKFMTLQPIPSEFPYT